MSKHGFVYRQLTRRPFLSIACGGVFTVFGFGFGLLTSWFVVEGLRRQTPSAVQLWVPLAFLLAGAYGLVLAARALGEFRSLPFRHPAVRALARYGDPQQVAAAVDAEVAEPTTARIGLRLRTFTFSVSEGSTYTAEAYLTRSWLVCLTDRERDRLMLFRPEGDLLTVFRLEDIVAASRVPAPPTPVLFAPLFPYQWVAVTDRHGVRLDMPFREADAARLLAELLARVPWALGRFDPGSQAAPGADAGRFVAGADGRSGYRITGPPRPTSPS